MASPSKSIDAGGGLGIDYHGGHFDPAAKVHEYAAAIDSALEGFEGRLLLEPGRFLVAQAGALRRARSPGQAATATKPSSSPTPP